MSTSAGGVPLVPARQDAEAPRQAAGSSTNTVTRIRLLPQGAAVNPNIAARHPNIVRTTRYTLASWLPKSLLHQFKKVANLFFLFVALSVSCAGCKPRGSGMAVTFTITTVIVMLMDAYEDWKRRRDDLAVNTQHFAKWDAAQGLPEEAEWQYCCPGDVVLIHKDEAIPADILVAGSSDDTGICYVSTVMLDGETALKQRQVPSSLLAVSSGSPMPEMAEACLRCNLELTLEPPTQNLMAMSAWLSVHGTSHRAKLENFMLRGSVLRNTAWCIGVVCFVGRETKVQLNSSQAPSKSSDLHDTLNRCICIFLAYLLSICFYITLASMWTGGSPREEGPAILCDTENGLIVLWRSVLVFYPMLPVTLYMMTQCLKMLCQRGINGDGSMQDDTADGTSSAETRAAMRTCDLVEELGQVGYIFSDKTGTLTLNEMRLVYCCVGEEVLGPFVDDLPACAVVSGGTGTELGASSTKIQQTLCAEDGRQSPTGRFFELLALCNTVQVDDAGAFMGESPDEVALVQAARDYAGVTLLKRERAGANTDDVTELLSVQGPWGQEQSRISHVLHFSSDRKRMTIICPDLQGGAMVLTKGADNVMEGLLETGLPDSVREANQQFARCGYRTLVAACRRLDATTFSSWKDLWQEASISTEDAAMDRVAALVESDLQYVGLTVLEDRLQEAVPETIKLVKDAGIQFWMLTGDKQETAVSIATACGLIDEGIQVTSVTGASSTREATQKLQVAINHLSRRMRHALVIDGATMLHVLPDAEARNALYDLSIASSSCVACRLSPIQKKELVDLVRAKNPRSISLAIGDGANDVPMIQAARLGVGVRGKEGTASVQASDVAIGKFRFLRNLLFCHGRKSYRRLALFLLWYIYKQILLSWSNILHASEIDYKARSCWPGNLEDPMNLLEFTSFYLLLRDSDVSDADALRMPDLYRAGPARECFNSVVVLEWVAFASVQGLIAWIVPMLFLTDASDRQSMETPEYWKGSITVYTTITVITYLKLCLANWRYLSCHGMLSVAFALLGGYPFVLFLLTWETAVNPFYTEELGDGVAWVIYTSPRHMCCTILVACFALVLDPLYVLLRRAFVSTRKCCHPGAESDVELRQAGGSVFFPRAQPSLSSHMEGQAGTPSRLRE